jgi:hypothetical protein
MFSLSTQMADGTNRAVSCSGSHLAQTGNGIDHTCSLGADMKKWCPSAPRRVNPQRLPSQAAFPKKAGSLQEGDYCFFTTRGDRRELHGAALKLENGISRVPLRKNDLSIPVVANRHRSTEFLAENCAHCRVRDCHRPAYVERPSPCARSPARQFVRDTKARTANTQTVGGREFRLEANLVPIRTTLAIPV